MSRAQDRTTLLARPMVVLSALKPQNRILAALGQRAPLTNDILVL